MQERDTVKMVIDNLSNTFSAFVGDGDDDGQREMFERLRVAVDATALRPHHLEPVETSADLALRNIAQTGFHINSLFVLKRMIYIYKERLKELEDQEAEFWSVPHRAPNYYARTIALRLARLYAKRKRKIPTFGMSREGNFASTEFGRALEKIFEILEIDAAVRNAADWAIGQLKEEDMDQYSNALAIPGNNALQTLEGSAATKRKLREMLRKGQDT